MNKIISILNIQTRLENFDSFGRIPSKLKHECSKCGKQHIDIAGVLLYHRFTHIKKPVYSRNPRHKYKFQKIQHKKNTIRCNCGTKIEIEKIKKIKPFTPPPPPPQPCPEFLKKIKSTQNI